MMKQNFDAASQAVEIIAANKQLTDDNYAKQDAEKLAQSVWTTIRPYVQQNIAIYKNWKNQTYEQRKKFVVDILNLLIEKYDGNNKNKPQIYFQEGIKPLWPKEIGQPLACCYSPTLSPWAKKYMDKTPLDAERPFFAFFHDLSDNGMVGQIVHEFTHYLQGMGKSSISYDVVKQAAEYYKYYYGDKNKYKQIYKDSIHEVEAYCVGDYANAQVMQMMQINDLALKKNNDYVQ